MGKNKINESEYEKIVDLYRGGVSQPKIAELYNVCRDTIGKILSKNNVDCKTNKVDPNEYSNIVTMYKSGTTQVELSNRYCVTQSTISTIIKNYDKNWKNGNAPIISQTDYENIINMYADGMTQSQIAQRYGCSASSISSLLKRLNVSTRPGGSKNDSAIISKWIEMYSNGMNVQDIAKEFNVLSNTVSKHLKKNGIEIDKYTYHFNEHYFDIIDTWDKAYYMGILWADGHNCIDRGGIILELQEKDVDLLKTLNMLVENERPIRKQKLNDKNLNWQNQYRLILQSSHTSKVLENYGMVNNKSLVLTFPTWLDEKLYSAFILGYFDGDGCISLAKNNHDRSAKITMVGTRMFLNKVSEIIKNKLDVNTSVYRDKRARDPICVLRCSRREDVIKTLNWLYDGATIYMQRKYEKYQQFLNNINNSYCA